MSDLIKFVRLDFLSIKPDLQLKEIAIYAVMGGVGYIILGIFGIAIGLMPLVTNLAIYPFSAGNNGLDIFYKSLSISRKTIVLGRYLFGVVLALFCIFAMLVIGIVGSVIFQNGTQIDGFAVMLAALFFVITTMNFITLPILFKVGFKKSRMLVMLLPLGIIVAITSAFHLLDVDYRQFFDNAILEISQNMAVGGFFTNILTEVLIMFFVWLAVLLVSAFASLKLYEKREF